MGAVTFEIQFYDRFLFLRDCFCHMEPPAVPPTPGPPELDLVLKQFWEQAMQDIASSKPDRKYSLPLSRIKKIMRFDEDVNMVSQEVLRMFDKCCLLFIQELTLRAWNSTLEAERKTVKVQQLPSR